MSISTSHLLAVAATPLRAGFVEPEPVPSPVPPLNGLTVLPPEEPAPDPVPMPPDDPVPPDEPVPPVEPVPPELPAGV